LRLFRKAARKTCFFIDCNLITLKIMTVEISHFSDNASRRRSRAWKKVFTFSLLVAIISALAWFNREALLRQAAEQWIVSDNIGPADAVAILGGGLDTRPFAAAEYYRKGLTQRILVANVNLGKLERLGVLPSQSAITRGVLIKLGVPETVIETFGSELSNTYEETAALREWAVRNHAKSVIVPTDVFSSRRVRRAVMNALAGTGTAVQVDALDHLAYKHADWWKNPYGVISFQNEVIKYVYYRVKY
jgi:uncharacterized SAM-binding protein YcdF (DUF218 family)